MLRRLLTVGFLLSAGALALGAGGTTPRQCQASNFTLSRGPSSSALAHFRQTVRMRNVTHSSCRMSGWPTVSLLNAHGAKLASHERRITSDMFGTSPKPPVTVRPGAGASFAIDTTAPATSCPHSKAVAVTPPGGHGTRRVNLVVLACSTFSVLPVQPDNKAVHP